MFHLTEVLVYLHYIADWRRGKGNVNGTFMKWRWDVLLLWRFPFGVMSKLKIKLGSLFADKDITYVLALSFSLLCSAIDCFQGAWSSRGCPANL